MSASIWVLGEALMDCVAQPDGTLRPFMGGSPFNMARAAALRGAEVGYVNPLSSDQFGLSMHQQLVQDGVQPLSPPSALPTSLAVVQIHNGQPSYGFYRDGIADRDYSVNAVLLRLQAHPPGVLHTGSLFLVPPEHHKVVDILQGAKSLGWTISIDVNLRPKLAADLGQYVRAVQDIAKHADWLKASDEDLALLGFAQTTRANSAAIAANFMENGTSRVALTFGAHGAWLGIEGNSADADVPVTRVVDTVGAGDTFWGNCLGDWVTNPQGAHLRVAQTLRQAMRAAAINCERAGCQPPRYAEVQAAE
ncbi:MAG TPA: hypothetical protein DHV01_12690 [Rhodoferax sp.]|uniref:PfkB family carbohydrate kinase n=1 Tax=Rhodoferax sp. TaxID=50421 RepID=UPI000EEE21D6|nr:PfkB family carbohydrate kinase [Rhodoferax sp.]HCX82437.1 hypothetical protein [Rhodoferax sp.]